MRLESKIPKITISPKGVVLATVKTFIEMATSEYRYGEKQNKYKRSGDFTYYFQDEDFRDCGDLLKDFKKIEETDMAEIAEKFFDGFISVLGFTKSGNPLQIFEIGLEDFNTKLKEKGVLIKLCEALIKAMSLPRPELRLEGNIGEHSSSPPQKRRRLEEHSSSPLPNSGPGDEQLIFTDEELSELFAGSALPTPKSFAPPLQQLAHGMSIRVEELSAELAKALEGDDLWQGMPILTDGTTQGQEFLDYPGQDQRPAPFPQLPPLPKLPYLPKFPNLLPPPPGQSYLTRIVEGAIASQATSGAVNRKNNGGNGRSS